jgi:hypothetical protein
VSPSSPKNEEQARPKDPTTTDASQLISAFNEIAIPGSPWPPVDEEEAARFLSGITMCLNVPGWSEDARALFALMPDHEICPFLAGKVKAKKSGDSPFNPEDAFAFLVADPTRVPAHLKRVLANQKKAKKSAKPTTLRDTTPEDSAAQVARLGALRAQAQETTR